MDKTLRALQAFNQTYTAVENYVKATNAESYHYRLVNPITEEVKLGQYKPDVLIQDSTIRFLRDANAKGFNIYCRPVGYQYILLDDLTRAVLLNVSKLDPCLLIETSPKNYQAWLNLESIPADRAEAKTICQLLAVKFGADLASADPDHVGRLPGFTNRKEKHRKPNGYFPFVELKKWEPRQSPFYPEGGAVFQQSQVQTANGQTTRHSPGKCSLSEQDYGVAIGLLKSGKTDVEVYDHLFHTSPDLAVRKGRGLQSYLLRTIANARKAL